MTDRQFEDKVKELMISTYIKVMGEAKWKSLTNEEKSALLHIMTKAVVEPMVNAL